MLQGVSEESVKQMAPKERAEFYDKILKYEKDSRETWGPTGTRVWLGGGYQWFTRYTTPVKNWLKGYGMTEQISTSELTESWRNYLNEELLVEVSFEDAKENLWKAAQKIVSGHYYDKWGKPPEGSFSHMNTSAWLAEPDKYDPKWRRAAQGYEGLMLQTVPDDLEDSQRGAALLWLIRLTRKDPNFREDVIEQWGIGGRGQTHLRNLIERFFQHQRFMSQPDINKLKSREELEDVVFAAGEAIDAYLEKKAYVDVEAGTEILRDDKDWKIAIISNKGAACELGKGTHWCTAAPGLDYFRQYYKPDDPLFFFLDKRSDQKFQFHYGSRQFMDHNDWNVEEDEEYRLHVMLVDALGEKIKRYPILLKQDEAWKIERLLSDRNSPPEELKKLADKILSLSAGSLGYKFGNMVDIAKHPRTPPETLVKIADFDLLRDQAGSVRPYQLTVNVARNPKTPTNTLDYLANANIEGNGGINVRFAVATNPSTTRETLQGLARGTDHSANAARKRVHLEERQHFKFKVLRK